MRYYLIAGEASGDLHGSNLMKELKLADDEAEFRFFSTDTKYDEIRFQIYWGDGEYFETPNPVVAAVGVILSHI